MSRGPLEKELYIQAMAEARDKIAQSEVFVCIVYRGSHDKASLNDQITMALEMKKPIYLLRQRGAAIPPRLDGVSLVDSAKFREEKEIVGLAKLLLEKNGHSINGAWTESPDYSGILSDERRVKE